MSIYYVIFADTADRSAESSSTSYATARNSTAASLADTNTTARAGQILSGSTYEIYQYFARLDLSAVPSGAGTGAFTLTVASANASATGNFEFAEASALTNKLSGTTVAGLTVLGSCPVPATALGTQFGPTFADISAMSRSATFNLVCFAEGERTNTAPTVNTSRVTFHTADATGTVNDPFIVLNVGTAWELVGVGSVSEVTATTHTLTEPAGAQAGDLLVASITIRKNNTTPTTLPTDWTIVGEQYNSNTATNTSATPSGLMAYIIRGASAPDLTFTHSGTISVAQGVVLCYRNADPTATLDASNSITSGTNVTAINVAAGVTTTQDDDLLVVLRAGGQESTVVGWSAATDPTTASGATNTSSHPAPNAWIERVDANTTTGNDCAISVFDAVKTAAGATGNMTGTASQGSAHVIVTGAFKIVPAGGGGTEYDQSVTANISVAVTFTRSAGKRVSATSIGAVMIPRSVGKTVRANATGAVAVVKAATRSVAVQCSGAAGVVKSVSKSVAASVLASVSVATSFAFNVTVDAAASVASSVSRMVGKTISAGAGSAVDYVRDVGKSAAASITAASAASFAVAKAVLAGISASASTAASRAYLRTIDAAVSAAAGVTRSVGFSVSAVADAAASVSSAISTTVTAAGNAAADVTKQASAAVSAAVNASVSVTRSVGKFISSTVTALADIFAELVSGAQTFPVTVDVALTAAGSVFKSVSTSVSAGVAGTAAAVLSVTKSVAAACEASVNATVSVGKSVLASAVAAVTVDASRAYLRTIDASVSVAGSVVKSVGTSVSSLVNAAVDINAEFIERVGELFFQTVDAAVSAGSAISRAVSFYVTPLVASVVASFKEVGKAIPGFGNYVSHPHADDTDGGWLNQDGGSTLYTSINEPVPDDDDYIVSSDNPSDDECIIEIMRPETFVRPFNAKYRYLKDGDGVIHLTVRLLDQEKAEIASWLHEDIADTAVTAEQALTESECNAVEAATGLYYAFKANAA